MKLLSHPLIKSILFWTIFMLSLVCSYFLGSFLPQSIRPYTLGVFGLIFAFIITYSALKLDKERFRDIGLILQGKTLPKFFKGFLAGVIIFGLIIAAIVNFTPMTLSFVPSVDLWNALLLSSIALIPQAWMEEIAFRSYPLIKLRKSFGIRFTIYIGAIAFALYHFIPGGNLLGTFLGPGIWGVVYGLMAIWTQGIAFPTGFHFALNISQAVCGMKELYTPIWKLVESESGNIYFSFEMDQVGLWIQLLILLISAFFIEVYIRSSSKS